MQRLQSLCINGLLAIASIALFSGAVEVGLRITGLQRTGVDPLPIYTQSEDTRIRYELKPNIQEKAFRSIVVTNSLGFRSPEPDDRSLVAVLGDSITFGYGVENDQTLPARLEALLPRHQFLNTAVPGYDLAQQSATYETRVADLRPSAVLLVFYWNDLDMHPPSYLDDAGHLRAHDWTPKSPRCSPITRGILSVLPGSLQCFLEQRSAFYIAFKKLVNMRSGNRDLAIEREEAKELDAVDPITTEQLQHYGRQLTAFTRLLTPSQERIFVIWPDRLLHTKSRPQLKRMAKASGFTVIDLYEIFGNEAKTLGWDTVHPHAETIEEAAVFIVEELQDVLE